MAISNTNRTTYAALFTYSPIELEGEDIEKTNERNEPGYVSTAKNLRTTMDKSNITQVVFLTLSYYITASKRFA